MWKNSLFVVIILLIIVACSSAPSKDRIKLSYDRVQETITSRNEAIKQLNNKMKRLIFYDNYYEWKKKQKRYHGKGMRNKLATMEFVSANDRGIYVSVTWNWWDDYIKGKIGRVTQKGRKRFFSYGEPSLSFGRKYAIITIRMKNQRQFHIVYYKSIKDIDSFLFVYNLLDYIWRHP